MPSSTRFSLRISSLLLLVAATTAMGGACSLSFEASLTSEKMGDGAGASGQDNDSGSTGVGGSGLIDARPPDGPGGQTSYMDLCGGGCMSGAGSIGCSGGVNPDGSAKDSCQVVPTASGASAECLPPGDAALGAPCMGASDCQPGLGCVYMPSGGGVCRPYCCADIEACEKGTYCTPLPMNEDLASQSPLEVPVCVPTTPCTLLDDTSCGSTGLTCTLVRADGSTSCVEPGEGLIGDPCPCAAGHVCSKTLQKCLQLCHVGSSDCPEGMLCQGGAKSFPDGIGVCVM